jgi:hypothetical protein
MEENLDLDLNLDFEIPTIILRETTVGNLAGQRVGCGNIYRGEYKLPSGEITENWVCELVLAATELRWTVGENSVFMVADKQYQVISVLPKNEEGRGKVILSEL